MSVKQRGNHWIVDFYRVEDDGRLRRSRQSLGPDVQSQRQAEQAEARLLAEIDIERRAQASGTRPKDPPLAAFSGFARLWFDTHVVVNLKPTVQDRYETIIRFHLLPYFGDRLITGITSLDVERFKAQNVRAVVGKTGRRIAHKTVNEHVCVLSSMFTAAVRWGYLNANPCRGVARLRLPPQDFRYYDGDQTEKFLDTMKRLRPDYYAFFTTAFRTGMRLGELLGLEWGDIDFGNRRILLARSHSEGHTTTPKSGKSRIIPISPALVDVLKAHRHLKGALVFCGPAGGHLTRDMVKHPFEDVIRAAGLHRIRIHDMRHSFASQLVIIGVPLKAVAELLGHSETRTTERYAHLRPLDLQSYVDLLEKKNPNHLEPLAVMDHG